MVAKIEPSGRIDSAVGPIARGIDRLIGLLGEGDESIVQDAMLQLSCLGTAAVRRLGAALHSRKYTRIRIPIVRALGVIGMSDPRPVIQILMQVPDTPRDWQVFQAIEATLGEIHEAEMKRRGASPAEHDGEGEASSVVIDITPMHPNS